MKPELKKWLSQRIAVLKQLAPKDELYAGGAATLAPALAAHALDTSTTRPVGCPSPRFGRRPAAWAAGGRAGRVLPSGVPMGDASPAPPAHAATMTPRHANPRSAGRPGVEGLLQQRWRGPARLGVSTFESGLCAAAFFSLVPRRCYNKPRDRPVSCAGMSPHFTSLWGAGVREL